MFAEARCVFLGFLVYISAANKVYGHANSICAFRGSTVDLPCTEGNPNSSMIWYTVHKNGTMEVLSDFSADRHDTTYRTTEESNFTLTITNLTESDAKSYCCAEKSSDQQSCLLKITELHVADLQVKVLPAAEGQTVTLMCSTSCRLTETPGYVWYRNGDFLHDDWSPWYQELVGSDQAVSYSCAVKGYEDVRAPGVSVDSVTSACFTVTYAEGRMCSHQQKSVDEPCSITYPKELHVNITRKPHYTTLTCDSSCLMSNSQTAYRWYWNNVMSINCESRDVISFSPQYSVVSCAIKGHEDLLSNDFCSDKLHCWSVQYASKRICALEGSSVTISSEASIPQYATYKEYLKRWYRSGGPGEAVRVSEVPDRVEFHTVKQGHYRLTINDVKKNDSAEYSFKPQNSIHVDLPRVLLVVTGLKVTTTPSAVVTEGQRVTLTCTTSCPLKHDAVFVWYKNGRPLTLPENRNKHLLLDPISLENAGNYSCVVMSSRNNVSSAEENLTVKPRDKSALIINAAKLPVILLMLTATFVLYLWMRTKKNRTSTNKLKVKVQPSQMDSLYESIALKPMNSAARAEVHPRRR